MFVLKLKYLLVFLYIFQTIFLVTMSLCRIIPAQLFDKIGSITSDFSWEFNHIHSFQNNVIGLHRVRTCEWRAAGTTGKFSHKGLHFQNDSSHIHSLMSFIYPNITIFQVWQLMTVKLIELPLISLIDLNNRL